MGKKGCETTLVGTRLPNDIVEYIQDKVNAREYSNLSHGVIRLITLGIRYEKEKDNRLIKKLFRRAPVAITITDPQGNILVCNTHITQLSGYTKLELTQMNLKDIYDYQDEPLILPKLLEGKESIKDYFVELKKQDGDYIGVLLSTETLALNEEKRYLTIANMIK